MACAADLVADDIRKRRAATPGRLVIGLSGAQGSGKSTVAARAVEQLNRSGVAAAVLSLDDFYLTKAQRQALARAIHPLLAVRGPPGTHDIAALGEVLLRLRQGEAATSPRFDKLADDRASPACDRVIGPAQVVLLEGWCVGAEPAATEDLDRPLNVLEAGEDPEGVWRRAVEVALAGAYRSLFAALDGLIFLQAPGFEVVSAWRLQQEAANARDAAPGGSTPMDAAAVDRFAQHYERITRRMLRDTPAQADLVIVLDEDRRVLRVDARARS